jgi:hypothetical protein
VGCFDKKIRTSRTRTTSTVDRQRSGRTILNLEDLIANSAIPPLGLPAVILANAKEESYPAILKIKAGSGAVIQVSDTRMRSGLRRRTRSERA